MLAIILNNFSKLLYCVTVLYLGLLYYKIVWFFVSEYEMSIWTLCAGLQIYQNIVLFSDRTELVHQSPRETELDLIAHNGYVL